MFLSTRQICSHNISTSLIQKRKEKKRGLQGHYRIATWCTQDQKRYFIENIKILRPRYKEKKLYTNSYCTHSITALEQWSRHDIHIVALELRRHVTNTTPKLSKWSILLQPLNTDNIKLHHTTTCTEGLALPQAKRLERY